jgi:16S rRNA (adenine1518-N6/adenine1519-N6)-dimethyltransferase
MSERPNLASPRVVKELLAQHDTHPHKRWGQNFLCDANIVAKIVDSVEISGEDQVLEIGGGLGTLTQAVAEEAGAVRVIEIDRKLIPILEENLREFPNVEIKQGDALELDWVSLFPAQSSFKAVGNLPYNITAPLLEKLVLHREQIEVAIWMLQLEVAEKITATPGTRQSSSIGIFVQSHCDVKLLFKAPKNAYYPRPDVDSAVIQIKPLAEPRYKSGAQAFNDIVRAAYGMRRKTLKKALKLSARIDLPNDMIEEILRSAEIDGIRRGETLLIEEFDRLAIEYEKRSG